MTGLASPQTQVHGRESSFLSDLGPPPPALPAQPPAWRTMPEEREERPAERRNERRRIAPALVVLVSAGALAAFGVGAGNAPQSEPVETVPVGRHGETAVSATVVDVRELRSLPRAASAGSRGASSRGKAVHRGDEAAHAPSTSGGETGSGDEPAPSGDEPAPSGDSDATLTLPLVGETSLEDPDALSLLPEADTGELLDDESVTLLP